jgi:hypothetical protein
LIRNECTSWSLTPPTSKITWHIEEQWQISIMYWWLLSEVGSVRHTEVHWSISFESWNIISALCFLSSNLKSCLSKNQHYHVHKDVCVPSNSWKHEHTLPILSCNVMKDVSLLFISKSIACLCFNVQKQCKPCKIKITQYQNLKHIIYKKYSF